MSKIGLILLVIPLAWVFCGCGEEDAEQPDAVAPATPTGLRATSTPGEVVLDWNAVVLNEDGSDCDDLRGYYVARAPSFASRAPTGGRRPAQPEAGSPNPVRAPAQERPLVTQPYYEDTAVQEGVSYEYWVTAVDESGNESSPSDTASLLHDTEAPVVTLDEPVDGALFNTDTVTVSGTVQDAQPITQVTILVNSLPATASVVGGSFSRRVTLQEGTNTIEAQATDASGHSSSSGVITVTVDLTAVIVTIANPGDGALVTVAQQLLSGTVSDTRIAQALLYLNDAAAEVLVVTAGAFSRTIVLDEGTNTVKVWAENDAGTEGSDVVTVTLDTVGPEVVIVSPSDSSTVTDTLLTVVGTVDDPTVDWVVVTSGSEVDSLVPIGGGFSTTVTLREGANVITASARDVAGNPGSDQVVVFVDARGPTVTITAPTDGAYITSSPIVVSGWVDDTSITSGSLVVNGVNWLISISQGVFTVSDVGLQEGYNTLQVRVVDSFGRQGVSEVVGVVLDTTAPSVELVTPSQSYMTNQPQLDVELEVEDDGGIDSVMVLLNGNPLGAQWQGGATWTLVVSLSEGSNTIEGTATDVAGNEGSSAQVVVTLDTVAEIEQVSHDAAGTVVLVGEVVRFSLIANEAGGSASVDIVPVHTGVVLYDDGTHGDQAAGDGTYEQAYVTQASDEVFGAQVVGHFTDALGNAAADKTADDPITINASPPSVTLSVPTRQEVSSSSVTLRWSASTASDFNRYQVFRGEGPGVDTLQVPVGSGITNPSVTTITDTDPLLQGGQIYYYRIFVWDSLGLVSGSNEVSATIDVWPSSVQKSIAIGPWPVEIARLAREGAPDLAYVTHFNDAYLKVSVINTDAQTLQATVDVGSKTVGVAADPWNRYVVVSCFSTSEVAVLHPSTHTVTSRVPLGGTPWGIGAMLAPDDLPYAVVGRDSGITVVSLLGDPTVFKDVPVPSFPGAVAASPDIFRYFICDVRQGQVYVMDAEYWDIAATIGEVVSPENLSIYEDHLYVVDSNGDELVVFDKHTHALLGRVPVGDRPMLAVRLPGASGRPASPYVYVSNYNDGTVGVVDVNSWEMIDEIPVGGGTIGPWGLLAMPDGEHVYVVNQGQATVSIIGF